MTMLKRERGSMRKGQMTSVFGEQASHFDISTNLTSENRCKRQDYQQLKIEDAMTRKTRQQ